MLHHNLSKLSRGLTGAPSGAKVRSVRALLPLALTCFIARPALPQAALTSDLWRVAEGTLVTPVPFADGPGAALWTPAALLEPRGPSLRVGIETIHTPTEIGVDGAVATVGIRLGGLGTMNLVYGRMGVDDLARTETSPELVGGSIPVYAQVLSLGMARAVGENVVLGAAARRLSGRLAELERSQGSLDFGVIYRGIERLRVGASTQFFDPAIGEAEQASSYSLGVAYRVPPFDGWGSTWNGELRYGATAEHGEEVRHLLALGFEIAALTLEAGASNEAVAGIGVWRSRLGLGLRAGRYHVQLARDGGVNGFGAAYRVGLMAGFR
jgi:hypothetical protein